jgi:hypothetical protein
MFTFGSDILAAWALGLVDFSFSCCVPAAGCGRACWPVPRETGCLAGVG